MNELIARAEMLIRKPAEQVFEALVRPDLLTQYWLASATGPLVLGAEVDWEFLVPGATERVSVTAFDKPQRLAFTWLGGGLTVDMQLRAVGSESTAVSVEVGGFQDGERVLAQVVDTTEGFSIVLCDLKALLETGRAAGLVRDKAQLIQMRSEA